MTDEEWDSLMADVAHEQWIMENNAEWWHESEVFERLVTETKRLRRVKQEDWWNGEDRRKS